MRMRRAAPGPPRRHRALDACSRLVYRELAKLAAVRRAPAALPDRRNERSFSRPDHLLDLLAFDDLFGEVGQALHRRVGAVPRARASVEGARRSRRDGPPPQPTAQGAPRSAVLRLPVRTAPRRRSACGAARPDPRRRRCVAARSMRCRRKYQVRRRDDQAACNARAASAPTVRRSSTRNPHTGRANPMSGVARLCMIGRMVPRCHDPLDARPGVRFASPSRAPRCSRTLRAAAMRP